MNELLVIDDLSVSFRRYNGGLRREILPCLSEISLLIGHDDDPRRSATRHEVA